MKKFLFIFLITLMIISCKKKEAVIDNNYSQLDNKALLEKYGAKSLTEDQINKIISSIKWTTNSNYELLGSKNAKKGGEIVGGSAHYPATLRTVGENLTYFNTVLESLQYDSLLGLHPVTLEYVPNIADKWSITDDKKTYYFHIDSRAKWSDGLPVTSYDYVATWDLLVSDGIKDPFSQDFWNKFERPVVLTPDILMIKPKSLEWRLFISAATNLTILPEHIIGRITPEAYMVQYNEKFIPGTGPYIFDKAETNQYIILKKNPAWWAIDFKETQGLYNFDTIKFIFYTDESIVYEKLLKGDIDAFEVRVARDWAQKFTKENYDDIKYNRIIRQKIYNQKASGIQGFIINTKEKPFDDIRIRKALYHLFNREKMMEKLFFNQYEYMDSYYSNSIYENKNNPKIRYNKDEAIKLLEQAGYSQKDLNAEGFLEKDGKVFEININDYDDDSRIETVFKEELENVGIKLNIKRVTWASYIKDLDQKNFKLASIAYTGSLFPNPEGLFHSKFSDKSNTNPWGYGNKRVDDICEKYNFEYDINKRKKLLQELDYILTNDFITIFNWYADYERLLYWNKFGMPEFVLSRFSTDSTPSILTYWWYDKELADKLKDNKGKKVEFEAKPEEVRFWDKYKK